MAEGVEIGLLKGEEIGLARGEEIGAQKSALTIACNLLDIISDNAVLAAKTGFCVEQIQQLRDSRKKFRVVGRVGAAKWLFYKGHVGLRLGLNRPTHVEKLLFWLRPFSLLS